MLTKLPDNNDILVSENDQLNKILKIIGSLSEEEMSFIETSKQRDYVYSLMNKLDSQKNKLSDIFSKTNK